MNFQKKVSSPRASKTDNIIVKMFISTGHNYYGLFVFVSDSFSVSFIAICQLGNLSIFNRNNIIISLKTIPPDQRPQPAQSFYKNRMQINVLEPGHFLVAFVAGHTKNIIGLRLALCVNFLNSDFDV